MRLLRAWVSVCLLTLIAGCADRQAVTEYRQVPLPSRFLEPCPEPGWNGGTFADLALLAAERAEALAACNRQLRAAREFQAGDVTPSTNRVTD